MSIQKNKPLSLLIPLALLILACRFTSSPPTATPRSTRTPGPTPTVKFINPPRSIFPSPNGRELGDVHAPVLVEVFSDFQCPACRQYATEVEPQIIQQYTASGKVHLIHRHFPFLGDESFQAAYASMCAVEHNLFWEYHDLLFANWDGENQGTFSREKLLAFAKVIELDMGAFSTCLDSKSYQSAIEDDLAVGKSKGGNSVPSVFVNGELITSGHIPGIKDIQKAIDEALGQP